MKVRWNYQLSSSFHQYHSIDQHKLNFGTKFLLEGKTVTTRNFRSFSKPRQFTIHQLLFTDYYSSFYYSSFLRSIWYSEKRSEILLFTWHYSFPEEISLFMCITHFIVNLVYEYLDSRNRTGSGANSCIIIWDISYGLEIVCIIIIMVLAYYSTCRIFKLILLV